MPAACAICQKSLQRAHSVSHSNIKTKRVQRPNLKTVKVKMDGIVRHVRVCTRCLRSGWVQKAA